MSEDTWQEDWHFHLDQEPGETQKIRGFLQFGGRLNVNTHFLPRANDVCKAHNLRMVQVDDFTASVDLHHDLYSVRAYVTLTKAGSP